MANRKNSHRCRVRVAVLMVLCGAVFTAFFARLAWMQFVRADYYADKAAEASSASYTVTQHAARGAIVDSAGVVLARDTTVYDVYLRIPAPPGTDLRETVKAIESLTGSKDVETQLAAFCSAASCAGLHRADHGRAVARCPAARPCDGCCHRAERVGGRL